jgi:hypothetical protein
MSVVLKIALAIGSMNHSSHMDHSVHTDYGALQARKV